MQVNLENYCPTKLKEINNTVLSFQATKNNPKVIQRYISETLGFPSKENLTKTIAYKNIFFQNSAKNLEALKVLYSENLEKLRLFFEKFNIKLEQRNGEYQLDISPELDEIAKQEFNDIILHKNALDMIKNEIFGRFLNQSTYNDLIPEIQYRNDQEDPLNGIYDSVIKKAEIIVGQISKTDEKLIDKKNLKLKTVPPILIINKVEKILNELNEFLNKKKWLESGVFSENDKTLIKEKVIEYKRMKKALEKYNIITENIENVYTKRNINLSTIPVGSYIDGEGLILSKTRIFDKKLNTELPCTLFLKRYKHIYELHLKKDIDYSKNKNFIEKYNMFKEKLLLNENIDGIKKELNIMSEELISEREQSKVAKISFKFDKLENLPKYFYLCDESSLNEFIKEYNKSKTNAPKMTYITDFANIDPKRYVNAGIYTGKLLLELLQKIKAPDLFIQAYNENKKSPVYLYLKAGFELIHPNKKEFENILKTRKELLNNPIFLYKSMKS